MMTITYTTRINGNVERVVMRPLDLLPANVAAAVTDVLNMTHFSPKRGVLERTLSAEGQMYVARLSSVHKVIIDYFEADVVQPPRDGSDVDTLTKAFRQVGVKYKLECRLAEAYVNSEFVDGQWRSDEVVCFYKIVLEAGSGYAGFETCFYFDRDGKFLDHACYE